MKKFVSFISGALLGGILGATIALLFAPVEGKAMQEKMMNTFIELKDEVEQAADSRRAELTEQLETLRKG